MDPEELEGGILSSVVPQDHRNVPKAAEKVIKAPVKVVGPGLKTGLNIIMDNPGSLGSDLVVDSVAAMAEYPLPLIIVDMGTATTVCVLNNKGNYIGGMILPGVRTSLDALVANAAAFPDQPGSSEEDHRNEYPGLYEERHHPWKCLLYRRSDHPDRGRTWRTMYHGGYRRAGKGDHSVLQKRHYPG